MDWRILIMPRCPTGGLRCWISTGAMVAAPLTSMTPHTLEFAVYCWLLTIAFQFPKHLSDDLLCRVKVLYLQSIRKIVDPWHLQAHRVLERPHTLVSQDDKGRPSVVWIRLEGNDSLLRELINDTLNVLTVCAYIARKPSDRLRSPGCGDGPKNLPTSTCQTQFGDQSVSRREKPIVEPKQVKNHL